MINIPGLISIIVFYVIILLIGIAASRCQNKNAESKTEEAIVAGRNIGIFVGLLTATATWVGGGYINGTAEALYDPYYGLLWAQAPIGYAISLFIGGLLFAKKMREAEYVTMLDPFQNQYGERMCGLLFLPCFLGETFWLAAILSALGGTISVILEFDQNISIIISAAIAVIYTFFGGLYSVAYTDVIQLCFIFVGLWVVVPFAMMSPLTQPLNSTMWQRVYNGTELQWGWLGTLDSKDSGYYIDAGLMLIFGGIPWQVYFQRVLSQKSARNAVIISVGAAFLVFLMAIPAALLGIIGTTASWENTTFGKEPIESMDKRIILPLVMQYLCPLPVAVVGLGAVSAAVMSSADSTVLSSASMFSRNVFKPIFWQNIQDRHLIWVMRVSIFLAGVLGTICAIFIPSIYGLWFLCSDFVYVIVFPQLFCVIYLRRSNTYGSLCAYIVGIFIRLTAGEILLGLPPLFKYPGFVDGESYYQRFPVKTFSMVLSFLVLIVVSNITHCLFTSGTLSAKFDIFLCFSPTSSKKDQHSYNLEPAYSWDMDDTVDSGKSSNRKSGIDNYSYDPKHKSGIYDDELSYADPQALKFRITLPDD